MEKIKEILSRLKNVKKGEGDNFVSLCPAHDDKERSLSIRENNGKILFKCFAGCEFPQIAAALDLPRNYFFQEDSSMTMPPLSEISIRKNLPEDFLRKLGWENQGRNIVIKYYDEDGNESPRYRIRSRDKHFWGGDKKEKIIPYIPLGLKKQKRIFIVEGESDCATLTYLGFPAIGVPGSGMAKVLDPKYFEGIQKAYVVIENDEGGKKFGDNVSRFLQKKCPKIKTIFIEIKEGEKGEDINSLFVKNRDRFPPLFEEMIKKTEENGGKNSHKENLLPEFFQDGKFFPAKALRMFIASLQNQLIFSHGEFWEYKYGLWARVDQVELKRKVQIFLGDFQKVSFVREILFLLEGELFQDVKFNSCWDKICFKNGVFCLTEKRLVEHSPKFFFNYQIPHKYRKGSRPPERWNLFLDEIGFSETEKIRMQEWFGYCLTSHFEINRRVEKCLYLIGEGANGKSTLVDTLSHLLGEENCVSIEPSEITNRFGGSPLFGKLANLVTDIRSVVSLEESFKKFISGETVTADRKHLTPLSFRPFAKQIFSSNNWMPSRDRSYGFYRRFDIFKFKKKFSKKEQDKGLKMELESETEEILSWSVAGLIRLVENDFEFSESRDIEENILEFQKKNDHTSSFLDEEGIFEKTRSIECKIFREKYVDWCESNGYKPLSSNKLGEDLSRIGIHKIRKRRGPKRIYFYEIQGKIEEDIESELPQDSRDPQDPQGPQDPQDPQGPQDPQAPQDPQGSLFSNEEIEGMIEDSSKSSGSLNHYDYEV